MELGVVGRTERQPEAKITDETTVIPTYSSNSRTPRIRLQKHSHSNHKNRSVSRVDE